MKFSDFSRYKPPADRNVFVFACEDDLLLEESREIWRNAFGGNWVFEKYVAKEFEDIPASKLMEDALTPSLFSQSRAIIVTHSEKLTKARLEALHEFSTLAHSSLKVILTAATAKNIDSWSKTFPVVEIDPLRPSDAARWLVDRYKLSPDVARYLVETLGTGLMLLNAEVTKLQTYANGRAIDSRDVDLLILGSAQFGPFELDDAVIAGDYRKSVEVLKAMLEDGVEPLMILARIVRVWRQLLVGKALVEKKSAKDVTMAAAAPVWKSDLFVAGCRKHDWRRLVDGFRQLVNADKAFKTSADPAVYFDVLLWKLLR